METLNKNCIKTHDLHLGFSSKEFITSKPINISIPVNEITALVGTNGSGKTTFLNAVLGEPVVQHGGVYLFDESKATHQLTASEISDKVSYVPQEHFYPQHLTVFTFLSIVIDKENEIEEMMRKMGVYELRDRVLTSLSSGQRQRVFLARALLQNAKLLLLDEPTNYLDPEGKEMFWKSLAEFKAEKKLNILVSTHDIEYVKRFCSFIVGLKMGEVVFTGAASEFFNGKYQEKVFKI